MLNLHAMMKRLESLEDEAKRMREPSKEQLLYEYFSSLEAFYKNEGSEDAVLESYSKVCKQVPVMHGF